MTRDPEEMTKAEFNKYQADQWPKEWAEKYWEPAKPTEDPTGEYDLGQFSQELDHFPTPEEQVNWWEQPEVRREWVYYWDGEPWITFHWASIEIKRRLGLSRGAAQRTLRELCAKGDIRSMQYEVASDDKLGPMPIPVAPERIKPSQWLKDELDLAWRPYDPGGHEEDDRECGGCVVEVSVHDFLYWLAKQPKPQTKATPEPSEKGKRPKIKRLLAEMYPNGVPDPAHCPRKTLKADLLKRDKSLDPLDEATLKAAIEEYNSDPKRSEAIRTRTHSD
jgi:hypothetical protein